MTLWSNTSNANSAPKFKILATNNARGNTMYANNNLNAFVNNQINGVYSTDPTGVANNSYKVAHDGWVLVRTGTGPVKSITVANSGTGYSNNDYVKVASYDANTAAANASIVTNGNGAIQSVTLISGSKNFIATESATVANSAGGTANGTGATFTVTFGGRAGRKTYETLVAAGSFDGSVNLP